MNKVKYCIASVLFLMGAVVMAQEEGDVKTEREPGHYNQSRFKQLYEEFATPNTYRSASGAPGPDYYQQQADYVINVQLDDKNAKINGEETITYHNNSPDDLEFLWVQLDQNVRAKDSKSPLRDGNGVNIAYTAGTFTETFISEPFDGGFNIESVKDASG